MKLFVLLVLVLFAISVHPQLQFGESQRLEQQFQQSQSPHQQFDPRYLRLYQQQRRELEGFVPGYLQEMPEQYEEHDDMSRAGSQQRLYPNYNFAIIPGRGMYTIIPSEVYWTREYRGTYIPFPIVEGMCHEENNFCRMFPIE